jgi:hypothetical protein
MFFLLTYLCDFLVVHVVNLSREEKSMSRNQQQHPYEINIKSFLDAETLEKIKQFAQEPVTLEDKLKLFIKLSTNHQVTLPGGRTDYRSRLGSFINKLFNSEMILPSTGRRQQIGNAIKFAEAYLRENPKASIYHATTMGAAEEYKEWMTLVGDLKPEHQLAIMNQPE